MILRYKQPVKKPKLTNRQKAILGAAKLIASGRILRAYNALQHEETTVGPYVEAVKRERDYAVIGWRGRQPQVEFSTASEAASAFVDRVGTGRALEAVRRVGDPR